MDSTDLQPSGQYPETWQRTDFDHFATLKRGKDLTRDRFRSGSVPVAGSNGVIGMHDTANVKGPGVTVGRSGSVGRVTFYKTDFWAHNTALFVTNFHGNDPRFVAYFLDFLKLDRFRSGVSVPTLDRNVFRMLPIIVPPIEEQRKIAELLRLLQRAIEQQERLLALTAELKKGLLKQLFTGGLGNEPQKQTELGPIPESWEITPLGKYCSVQGGFAFKSSDYVSSDSGIPIIKIGDLQNGEVKLSDRSSFVPARFWEEKGLKNFRLTKGHLLIALTGATTGKTAEFRLETRALLNQRVGRFLPDQTHLKSVFLKNLVLQPYFQAEIQRNILAAAQGNVSPKTIEHFLVAVPAVSEQEEIGTIFRTLDEKITLHRRRLEALGSLFRTLLHELMTARIRVAELQIEDLESL